MLWNPYIVEVYISELQNIYFHFNKNTGINANPMTTTTTLNVHD